MLPWFRQIGFIFTDYGEFLWALSSANRDCRVEWVGQCPTMLGFKDT